MIKRLLAFWAAYWVGLVAVTLGPAVPAILRATQQTGNKGRVSVSAGNVFELNVDVSGQSIWHGAAHFSTIALWMCVPPLLIWFVMLYARPKRTPAIGASPSHLIDAPPADLPVQQVPEPTEKERRR